MQDVLASISGKTCLGRLGENKHTRIIFDVSKYLEEYPSATLILLNRIPGQSAAYPVSEIETDGVNLIWTVADTALTCSGIGQCELVIQSGESVAKSILYITEVLDALDDNGSVPNPWESWLTVFQGYVSDASEYASAASDSATAASASAAFAAQRAYGLSISGSTLTFTPPSV